VRLKAARIEREINGKLPIALRREVANLSNDQEIERLCADLVAINEQMQRTFGVRLGVILIDTVAASFSLGKGDPNAEAAATIRRMRRIEQAISGLVVPVHHYGKDETTGLLGASGWRAGCEAVLSVLADRNQITGEVKNRSLALAKSRVGAEGPIAPFELPFVALGTDDDGDVFGSLRVEPRLGEKVIIKASGPPKVAKIALRALQEALSECGENSPTSNHIPAGIKVTTQDIWRKYAYLRAISASEGPRAKQMAFKRGSEWLIESGAIGAWDEYVWTSTT
jgi:hypothetical protein